MGGYTVDLYRIPDDTIPFYHYAAISLNNVILPNSPFNTNTAPEAVTHELAHVWDTRHWFQIGFGMMYATNSYRHECRIMRHGGKHCYDIYDVTKLSPAEKPPKSWGDNNAQEGWAVSFEVFQYPFAADPGRALSPLRRAYIQKMIAELP
jgi:hypothetical protein